MSIWFEDLEGTPVEEGSLPVTKIFVIDPQREISSDLILRVTAPETYEQVVRTNATSMDALAAFSGAMPSRGQARKNGFAGPIPEGLHLYGVTLRSFWVYQPWNWGQRPTIGKSKIKTQHYLRFRETMGWPLKKEIA